MTFTVVGKFWDEVSSEPQWNYFDSEYDALLFMHQCLAGDVSCKGLNILDSDIDLNYQEFNSDFIYRYRVEPPTVPFVLQRPL